MNNFDDAVRKLYCKVIYDIGANKGKWSDLYRRKFPNATLYSFEANPKLNPKSAHKNFNVALYHTDNMELDFYVNTMTHHTTGNSFYKENTKQYDNESSIKLKTKKLDTLVMEEDLKLPDALKIDTQGAELDILKGASKCVENAKVIMTEMSLYEYNRNGASFDEVNTFLRKADFVPIAIEEQHWFSNILLQLDIVYIKRTENLKYFPNAKDLR